MGQAFQCDFCKEFFPGKPARASPVKYMDGLIKMYETNLQFLEEGQNKWENRDLCSKCFGKALMKIAIEMGARDE